MTTWTAVDQQTTTYTNSGGGDNGYVLAGYMVGDYVDVEAWNTASASTTTWTVAA